MRCFICYFIKTKITIKILICFDWELPIKVIRVFYGFTGGHNYFSYCFVLGVLQKKVSVLLMGNAERMQWQMRLLMHFLFFHINVKLVFQGGR